MRVTTSAANAHQYGRMETRVMRLAADWRHAYAITIAPRPLLLRLKGASTALPQRGDCVLLRVKPRLGRWELTLVPYSRQKQCRRPIAVVCKSHAAWVGHPLVSPPSLAACEPKKGCRRSWSKNFPHAGCYRGVMATRAGEEVVCSMDLLNGRCQGSRGPVIRAARDNHCLRRPVAYSIRAPPPRTALCRTECGASVRPRHPSRGRGDQPVRAGHGHGGGERSRAPCGAAMPCGCWRG